MTNICLSSSIFRLPIQIFEQSCRCSLFWLAWSGTRSRFFSGPLLTLQCDFSGLLHTPKFPYLKQNQSCYCQKTMACLLQAYTLRFFFYGFYLRNLSCL